MGRSAEAAAETRKSIVNLASEEFRQNGFSNVGLADLMSQLGLTHGGFYRHFANKDQLIAEACQESFARLERRWPKNVAPHTMDALTQIVSRYLSAKERDNPKTSCVLACLSNDFARSNEEIRKVATQGFRTFCALIQKALPEGDEDEMSQEACNVACTLIGTLQVARLVTDRKLSNNLLASGRDQILKNYERRYESS